MSYINDALRKARRENKDDDLQLIDVFSAAKTETSRSPRRLWVVGILGVLLLAGAATALLYWHGEKQSRQVQQRPVTAAVQPSAEKKATKLGYQVKIRLAYLGESSSNAKLRMQAIVGTFKQYNSTNLNGFKITNASFKSEDLAS